MWNEGVIIFFKSTRFLLHQSTRMLAHYQLTLLKLYFTAWLLASVYECEISGLKLTEISSKRSMEKRLCLNWKKWVLGAAVSRGRQDGRQLVFPMEPSTLSMGAAVLASAVTAPPSPGPAFPSGIKSWRCVAEAW